MLRAAHPSTDFGLQNRFKMATFSGLFLGFDYNQVNYNQHHDVVIHKHHLISEGKLSRLPQHLCLLYMKKI